ncbi:DNA polymerase III subunit beta [Buchnera aphidicola]|uniref:DNA polymerase III subunit beta n=1 Tax=Buchnera aphidicola TaxID=9 RepID=UPI002092D572|nr:DNA polymerase III subunit beta [Buchnera aphidicola]USS94690.1 DNA polymerase III subunit beta [Buchnera aphidicola (Periphyllus lyropictus)]
MKFTIEKKKIIKPLQKINSLITKKSSNEILGNILIEVNKKNILITATNTEIELIYKISNKYKYIKGKITVSGKKILEIFRIISDTLLIKIKLIKKKLYIFAKNSKFYLLTISAKKFPYFKKNKNLIKFYINQNILKNMLKYTFFSMPINDVRPYLNGTFLEFKKNYIRSIATNGHRMSIFKKKKKNNFPIFSIILPRKSTIELNKLLKNKKKPIKILFNKKIIQIYFKKNIFTSKLVNSQFPKLDHILIQKKKYIIKINKNKFKKALSHVSILVHEQIKGIYLKFKKNLCIITSSNHEEKAQYKFQIKYNYSKKIKLSVNINYLLDVLNVLKYNFIYLILDENVQCLQIEVKEKKELKYIILPLYI